MKSYHDLSLILVFYTENHHTEHGNNEQLTLLHVWKGDLGDSLRQAAAKKQLNDWLMAMAPMGKYDLSFHVLRSVSVLTRSKKRLLETVLVILATRSLQCRDFMIGA